MSNNEHVSPYFSALKEGAKFIEHRLMFADLCKALEIRDKIRIVVVPTTKMPAGGSMIAPVKDSSKYLIFVNQGDLKTNPALVRFRVGHELAHIAAGHIDDQLTMTKYKKGDASNNNKAYVLWRNKQEDEADIFAANLFLSHGEVVERHIPTDEEYESKIGKNNICVLEGDNPEFRESRLNNKNNREDIRKALVKVGHLRPPVPILCSSLEGLDFENIDDHDTRRELSVEIQRKYREILNHPNPKYCERCAKCLE